MPSGAIANVVRRAARTGNIATYIHNQYINYSNICLPRLPVLRVRRPASAMPMRSS